MTDAPPKIETTQRVSSLELFFDLVFVFTITQLTNVLVREPSWRGLLQVSLMLGLIFWMYGGYAWLTNSVAVDRLTRRLTLLGGMAGFFVVALAIPRAFSGAGAEFGIAYLAVVLIHMGMFARSSQLTVVRAIVGLVPFNLSTALLVLVGGIAGGAAAFLVGEAMFRRTLGIAGQRWRALTAGLALATIPIGSDLSAALQLVVLIALFIAMLVNESQTALPSRQ